MVRWARLFLLVAGFWLLVTCYLLLVFSCWPLVSGFRKLHLNPDNVSFLPVRIK
jgi:hypothetical protein